MRAARDPGAVLLDPAAGEPLARWLDYLTATRGRAALTREAYGTSVAGFLGFMQAHLGEAPVPARLAALAIADFRAWMAARRMQGVGARTLARDLAAVRGFFAWIEETQGLHCPAVLALATPKIRPGLPRPVAANDAVAVLDRVAARPAAPWIAARDVAVLTLLWSAGLRIGEALGVPWRAAPLGPSLRVTGKGGRERDVPVLPVAAEAVEAYRRACPHRPGPSPGRSLDPEAPLFLGVRGGRLTRSAVAAAMADARRTLGLPDSATPHALRHAFATQILQGSGDLRAVQTLLGHRSLSSTQVYTRIDDTGLVAAHAAAHPRATGS